MADLDKIVKEIVKWEKQGILPPGTRIRVVLNDSNVLLDRTVPADRQFRGAIQIIGELEPTS